MRRVSGTFLRGGLIALLAGPLAAGPFDGLYRPDYPEAEGWDCRSVGSDGGALSIEGEVFKGVGLRDTDVWDSQPEGVYVPVGARAEL